MRCSTAERWLLRSLDQLLDEGRMARLEKHQRICPACAQKGKDYRILLGALRQADDVQPLPDFWERLQVRLPKEKKPFVLLLWERWCLRAIPVFLGAVLVFGAALVLLAPRPQDQMTQSELLLLRGQNAISEVPSIFEGGKAEDKHMKLIFADADELESLRRKIP